MEWWVELIEGYGLEQIPSKTALRTKHEYKCLNINWIKN